MEKRRHKRIYVHLKASIMVDDQTFDGYVENISESGVGYLISSPGRFKDDYLSSKSVELNLLVPSGKTIILNCVAIWAKKGLTSGKTIGVGMRIIEPPSEYQDWIKTVS